MDDNQSVKRSFEMTDDKKTIINADLPDSPHDQERLQVEEVIFDLPDVSDIPGQENIVPPKMNMFADTTISSDDEEGISVFGDEKDNEDV
ncbi:MAG: hypothetical protein WKF35_08120 [Ferruginibacter sp.]